MACISAPTAILAGGALSAGSSAVSGLMGSSAASTAAKEQAQAATEAAHLQFQEYQHTQDLLNPFVTTGQSAIENLSSLIGVGGDPLTAPLTAPIGTTSPISTHFSPTNAALEATPGYQFTLAQGTKAAQNSLAAQGLGKSGAATVGATQYASGLASGTYQNQFGNWLSEQNLGLNNFLSQANLTLAQRQQIYNMLGGLSTTGESAAAGAGTLGIQSAAQVGNSLQAAGAATASGTVGSTNALTSGLTGAGNAASNTALLTALNNAGMFGSSANSGQPGFGGSINETGGNFP